MYIHLLKSHCEYLLKGKRFFYFPFHCQREEYWIKSCLWINLPWHWSDCISTSYGGEFYSLRFVFFLFIRVLPDVVGFALGLGFGRGRPFNVEYCEITEVSIGTWKAGRILLMAIDIELTRLLCANMYHERCIQHRIGRSMWVALIHSHLVSLTVQLNFFSDSFFSALQLPRI